MARRFRRFRREKLAEEPKRVRGYRMIKSGQHRVLIALLPGGGSRAVALLHPISERNPCRRCKICGASEKARCGHKGPRTSRRRP